ncbi:MAG: WD40/YVTN/BNR-like repeat-containing protein [Actinomycetota bacterium]
MRLFLGGSNGLFLYEDGELSPLHAEPTLCMARPSQTRLVAGTEGGAIVVWDSSVSDCWVSAKDIGDAVHSVAAGKGGNLFAGTIPAAGWMSKDLGDSWLPLTGFAEAPNREGWSAPWGIPLASALATHPKDARTVYLGVEVGGLYRSRDRGKTWYDLDLPSSDVHSVQVSPARPDRVYATTGEGAFCSDDGGFNWRKMAGHANAYTMGLAAHPGEPDRVIISAAKTPPPGWGAAGGARCDVYLSTDAGRRFRTVAKALKGAVQRRALLINPKVPSEVVFGTSTGELYYSNDGGESFDLMETGLGDIKAITFA